jgi:hypothetical protein
MIAESFDIIRMENGMPLLFQGSAQGNKMLGVRIADESIGNLIVELTDLENRSEADLVGREMVPSILFHHMGPGMRSFMHYLARNHHERTIAMVGVSEHIPIATLFQHLPITCTVDVSHLITCNPQLFERLKPHLHNGSFELTEDLFFELKLSL